MQTRATAGSLPSLQAATTSWPPWLAIACLLRCCVCRYFNLSGAHALLATNNGPGVVAAYTLSHLPPEKGLRACANLAGLVPAGEARGNVHTATHKVAEGRLGRLEPSSKPGRLSLHPEDNSQSCCCCNSTPSQLLFTALCHVMAFTS
jgi:hypothetical protein